MRTCFALLLGAGALLAAAPAAAADHQVRMLSSSPNGAMVFQPALIRVAPGDTVTFVPTHPTHNAESIPGIMPAGAAAFRGRMNQPIRVSFDRAGVYGYKCAPHVGMGMVGLVVVGNGGANLAAARQASLPGRARQVMTNLLNQAGRIASR